MDKNRSNEKTFTGEDLKRLKDFLRGDSPTPWAYDGMQWCISLIARLEAAEQVCNKVPLVRDTVNLEDEWQAWRKAAGK